MTPRVRLTKTLDFIGTAALTAAAAAPLGKFWFGNIAETTLFTTFFAVLAFAVSTFLLARVVQLTGIIIDAPNERARRVYQAASTNLTSVTTSAALEAQAQSQATDLQRAA